MPRKTVYFLVVILTLVLAISDQYITKDLENVPKSEKTEERVLKDNDSLDDAYKAAQVVAPLTIKNYQNDNRDVSYLYNIKVENLEGAYRYTIGDVEKYIVFAANGEASFYLKSNETITIYDIPVDLKYTVKQETILDGIYTIKTNNVDTDTAKGTITLDNNIIFNNETVINEETNKNNPTTADLTVKIIILLLLTIIAFLAINRVHIKRFE